MKIYGCHHQSNNKVAFATNSPFDLRIPSGLGAFFSRVTLNSIGISLEHGGLYSWNCPEIKVNKFFFYFEETEFLV